MLINQEDRKPIENARRERLKKEKPLVYEKIIKYNEKEARGESTAMIDLCFDYACNMNCTHCSNLTLVKKERSLTLEDLKDFSDQADKMGLAQFTISGGEPLVFKDLDGIIKALNPEKFHIGMSTNGLLLNSERAKHLKSVGLDKVKISLDSIDEKVYAQTRKQSQSYHKAIEAMYAAKDAGLQVCIQTVISHQNARTEATEHLAKFAQDNGFNLDIMTAKAIGRWEGKEEVLIDEEDANYLLELRAKYPLVHRDVFPTYGREKGGCVSVKKNLHLTKYGDILPCGFIHISIGNIFNEPLKDIIQRGLSIRYFKETNPVCLAGEDRLFITNYMSQFYGKPLPIHWSEVFNEEDFVAEG